MSMKNSTDKIGNRPRDLPICSAVLQPTAPPCAPLKFLPCKIQWLDSRSGHFTTGKNTTVPIKQETVWIPERVWTHDIVGKGPCLYQKSQDFSPVRRRAPGLSYQKFAYKYKPSSECTRIISGPHSSLTSKISDVVFRNKYYSSGK
jgi:hypothetical protein